MKSDGRKYWSTGYKQSLKTRISLILKSPRVAYWRICGKEAQRSFLQLVKNHDNLQALLDEIVLQYEIMINEFDMTNKERKVKLNNIHRYAEGRY